MILARVIGQIVATQKEPSHEGKKILLRSAPDDSRRTAGRSLRCARRCRCRRRRPRSRGSGRIFRHDLRRAHRGAHRRCSDRRRGSRGARVIAHLRGKLAEKEPARVVIDVNGVGYEVFIPTTTFTAMPECRRRSLPRYPHARPRGRSRAVRVLLAPGASRLRTPDHDFRHRATARGDDSVGRFCGRSCRRHPARRSCAADVDSRRRKENRRTHRRRVERQAAGFHARSLQSLSSKRMCCRRSRISAIRGPWRKPQSGAPSNGDEDAAFDVLFKRALQILTKE